MPANGGSSPICYDQVLGGGVVFGSSRSKIAKNPATRWIAKGQTAANRPISLGRGVDRAEHDIDIINSAARRGGGEKRLAQRPIKKKITR
jgi:hypothetical protein